LPRKQTLQAANGNRQVCPHQPWSRACPRLGQQHYTHADLAFSATRGAFFPARGGDDRHAGNECDQPVPRPASGAEIDLKMTRQRFPTIGSLIGDSTLAETYYYQDQTSPSVLKGLAANRSRLRWALVAQHFPRTASASSDNSLSVTWGIARRARGRVRVIIQSFSS
jgi:hypothetical protein